MSALYARGSEGSGDPPPGSFDRRVARGPYSLERLRVSDYPLCEVRGARGAREAPGATRGGLWKPHRYTLNQ